MSCNAILKNLYEPKMDVVLTIRFKITAEIEITKNICFVSYVAEEDVYRRFEKHNYVLSFIHCHGICVYIVFLLLIVRLMRLAIILPEEVSRKSHEIKDFSQNYVISFCGVVVRCSRGEPTVPRSSPTKFFFSFFLFFSVFCVAVFYKYIAK